ncbi:hypothetical protein AB5J52_14010 [Streptomyces sp. R39]|uniref:Uncharacterized protein n=1 Tax=Streptomyces sp. R39 TaxID=3238631 RepID=A0AB39QP94_9ACTN
MNGWRVFATAQLPDGAVLAAPVIHKLYRLPSSSLLFDSAGPYLDARCTNTGHVPPEPDCECGLYFWAGPLPINLLREGLHAPVLAEVEARGRILDDPIIKEREPFGVPQRAGELRLRHLWTPPNTCAPGLRRYGVPVTPWRLVGGRAYFDGLEAA